MKVCGFTFVRNAVRFDYPVIESIKSVLPLCDRFLINAGNSDDDTDALLATIDDSRIKIVKSTWDDSLREGGKVLAVETNKAMDAIDDSFDWLIYIQADEVLHESDYRTIKDAMEKYLHDKEVEGLLFKYRHFYGTYDFIADSRKWYRNEIRIIRNNKNIRSYKDAQGFRINDRKLNVALIDADVHHYGWVKDPHHQKEKEKNFHRLWHDDTWMEQNVKKDDVFDYSVIDSISRFKGSHPKVMMERISNRNWTVQLDPAAKKLSFKNIVLQWIEKLTGYRLFEYRNYKRIR